MQKNYIRSLTVFLFFLTGILSAQQQGPWSRADATKIINSAYERKSNVKNYKGFELQGDFFSGQLLKASVRKQQGAPLGLRMVFPDAEGNMVEFMVHEAPVMEKALAEKFSDNRSYAGISTDGTGKKIRFSWNEIGLHALIIDAEGNVHYIEPAGKDKTYYKVYKRKDLYAEQEFFCELVGEQYDVEKELSKKAVDLKLRTYRLAIAATSDYSAFHLLREGVTGGTEQERKAVVLAAITTAITRVNAVFENDLAITMQLVGNNDEIIYLDAASDPYLGANNLLDANQSNLDQVIMAENYDIGHVFGADSNGGVARLASACRDGSKARGSTSSSHPVGESFYFDFVAHELGHQFGANHTFNGDEGSCGQDGQRNDPTAVEPGSGSTLMAYAGLCSPQNVQLHSDLYFHIISIEEILNYINGSNGNCAEESDLVTNLNVPVASAGPDFIIPVGTAFVLRGTGSDGDNDPLTYTWEQTDNAITAVPPSPSATGGAVYRSLKPGTSPDRYLPDLRTIASGNLSSTWEVTPEVFSRILNFRLTVRDNNPEAGQIDSDDLRVTVIDEAGPFLVTSQAEEGTVWTPGMTETITWDVAGTNANGINVSSVNIRLSVDGGLSYPIVLANNVPNDGTQIVAVPNDKGSRCFVMVEAVGNFFFAVNAKSFSIGSFNEICGDEEGGPVFATDTPLVIPDNNPDGVTSEIEISDDVVIEKLTVHLEDLTHTYLSDLNISLESPAGTVVELLSGACDNGENISGAVFDDEGQVLECAENAPAITGTIQAAQALSLFNGESAQGTWKLHVQDVFEVDFGILNSWGLKICTSEPVLGVDNYAFEDFSFYPNPTDGLMQVKFFSEEEGDVELSVYDILGRKVHISNFKNVVQDFKESINLGDLSPGLYILRVKQANKIAAHKLKIR